MQEDAAPSDWFSDFEDDTETRAEVERTFERAQAVAAERQRVERVEQDRRDAAALRRSAAAPAPDAIQAQAQAKLGALHEELKQIDGAYATTPLPELQRERALVVSEIRPRERALPYVGRTDDELAAEVEPAEIAIEEARERMDKFPETSARGRVARREYEALLNEREALAVERRKRAERASVVQHRERQITKYAQEAVRSQYADKVAALMSEQRGTTGLQRRELQLEIDAMRIEMAKDPTPEHLAKVLPKVTADYDERIMDHARRSAASDVLGM